MNFTLFHGFEDDVWGNLNLKIFKGNQKGLSRKTLIRNKRKKANNLITKSCLTGSEPDLAMEIDPKTLAQGKALRISVLLRQAIDHIQSWIFISELLKPVALCYTISQAFLWLLIST